MRKIELTERMAVGLSGALKLLEAAGLSPETVLPFVREVVDTLDTDGRSVVNVELWFYHQPKKVYRVSVWMLSLRQLHSNWTLSQAAGATEGIDPGISCRFDEEGQVCELRGECHFTSTSK